MNKNKKEDMKNDDVEEIMKSFSKAMERFANIESVK